VKPPLVDPNAPWRNVMNDWFRDGRIDHRYSCATLATAVAHLPRDGPEDGAPIRAYERQRCGLRGIPSLSGGSIANTQAGDPFEALPLVAPGQLAGRIRYLSNKDCELREFELETGADTAIAPSHVCAVGWPVFSPNGSAVAARDGNGQIIVERVGDPRLVLGEKTPHVRLKAPASFVVLPTFSSDGRMIAFCTRSRTRLRTIVADLANGVLQWRQGFRRGGCVPLLTSTLTQT